MSSPVRVKHVVESAKRIIEWILEVNVLSLNIENEIWTFRTQQTNIKV